MPKIVLDLENRYVLDDGTVVLRRKALLSCIRSGRQNGPLASEKTKEVERHNKLSKPEKRIAVVEVDSNPGVIPRERYEWPTPEPWKSVDLLEKALDRLHALGLGRNEYYLRLAQEIAELEERGMDGFVRHVCFICEDMDRRGVVRGVGRGSSCASLVLFLLGVHMVDPVLYKIPVTEFFKPITTDDEDDVVPAEEIGA